MHHSISYQRYREAVAAKTIRVTKQGNVNILSDMFTKVMTSSRRRFIIENFTYSYLHVPAKVRDNPHMVFIL